MNAASENVVEFVTATVGGQLFGLPISRVQDVFKPEGLTRVPLAAPEIAGLLNLRGRIVTVIDLRRRLDFERRRAAAACSRSASSTKAESYGLLIESIGEVLRSCRRRAARTIRSISTLAWRGYRRACTASMADFWLFSTSTACSTSALSLKPREPPRRRMRAGECQVSDRRCGVASDH